MSFWNRSCIAAMALMCLATEGWPQTPVTVSANSAMNGMSNLPLQKLGPEDLIGVSVYDSPELTRTVRLSTDGTLRLPMVKQRIKAAGLLPAELEVAIADVLKAEQLFVDPVVTVSVVEYRSIPVSVVGAVKQPLTFQAYGNVTLLDAISRAGGLTPEAGGEILISKPQPGEGGKTVMLTRRIALRGLIDEADPELNVHLEGGEEVRVPEQGKVYIVGNVKRPGAFPVKDATETSVMTMLAQSEGLAPYSTNVAYIYRQEAGQSGKSEIPIELAKIMKRKSPDVALQANDILYIPDNTGKRRMMTALERMSMFGTSTVSGILIWSAR